MNYTPEQTLMMVARYSAKPCRETVDELAAELDKSIKSIIGKLSREGVYRRQIYTTKQGDPPIRKEDLVAEIAAILDFEPEQLSGLDKTPKLILKRLKERLESW